MITVIVGQRGVGKTQLLKRIHRYTEGEQIPCFDLDQEIEKFTSRSIRSIFESEGEEAFREIEKNVFHKIIHSHPDCFLAVGGGFPVGLIPPTARILWVQRATDQAGRIFLDRPRLEKDLPPLQEYERRSKAREFYFKNAYDQIYIMPEGLLEVDPLEEDLLLKHKKVVAGAVTLLPELFVKASRWHRFIESFTSHGVEFFEVRDDLLNPDQIKTCLGSLFAEKFIYSFRTGQVDSYPRSSQIHYYDWPLESGAPPEPIRFLKQRLILSLHELQEGEDVEGALQRLNAEAGKCVHLKLAPLIESFEDLKAGYLWQQEDPQNRSFLPRSKNGRWAWFRLWMKGRQLLNFWREAEGSAKDQPVLYDWLSVPFIKTHFAAILGKPVSQSWTPLEQRSFFGERNEPVLRIEIDQREWDRALPVLTALGLRHAAVTSPLKEEAYHSAHDKTPVAELLHSVNTLVYDPNQKRWKGHNTDLAGFRELTSDIDEKKCIVLWGGGGTLSMMKKVLPNSFGFSARRGEVREEDESRWEKDFKPDILIWAAPRKDDMKWPAPDWKPSLVIDLNYTDDSPGREYALKVHAPYRSGLKMFQAQAQHQRDFWETET